MRQNTCLPLPRIKTGQLQKKPAKSHPMKNYVPRRGAPRTRTGCKVCRIRKIKCDETKPSCFRCTSTGRKCEGYTESCQMSIIASLSDVKYGSKDSRYLHIFRLVSEGEVSLHLESTSWTRLVLQLAEVYPSVRCSARAIGTMYESCLQEDGFTQRSQGASEPFQDYTALSEYTSAVKSVADDLTAQRLPLQIILICCLMFIWLEILRNNYAMAMMHLQSGINIIQGQFSTTQQTGISQAHSGSLQSVGLLVYRMFTRLHIQAALHGMASSTHSITSIWVPPNTVTRTNVCQFSSLQEAASSLDILMLHIAHFVHQNEETELTMDISDLFSTKYPQLQSMRESLLAELGCWYNAFCDGKMLMTNSPERLVGFNLLEVQYLTSFVILNTAFPIDDVKVIELQHHFERIVLLSSRILDRCASANTTKALSLCAGLTPALFFTVLKCRVASLRNEAQRLLKRTPAREGLWHRDTVLASAIEKINMEENLKTGI